MTVSLLPVLAAASADSPPAWLQFLPFIGMGLVMWFFLLRPQMQQQKNAEEPSWKRSRRAIRC
jgi:preprotein translocase subunit YajC